MYERALVPIDRSELSREPLVEVARLGIPSVVLLSVVESVSEEMVEQTGIAAEVPRDVAVKILEAATARARRRLQAAEQELRERGWNGSAAWVTRHGKPGQAIVAVAEEMSCDVILMGTQGGRRLTRALRRSVADYVIAHSPSRRELLVRPGES
ncbi:MAG: universal stress protein [Dehalococcoidia bacterium]